jgi:lipopolysaccharide biosynthesis protein
MTPLFATKETRVLAFFLPQYHPIPENNEWWGNGFTEWTNVMRGKPLFTGHYQPHFPADLGFYDLRVPEVREHQAELAREAGVDGFVYYHYWFSGRRLLERPVNDIMVSGKPDFPFALCWANEPWSRNWDGQSRHVLMPQQYSTEDDLAHITYLLEVFKDPRYIKHEGRPLLLVYRPSALPNPKNTFNLWQQEARKAGFPGLHLCSVGAFPDEYRPAAELGMDVMVSFRPNLMDCGEKLRSSDPLEVGYRLHSVWPYERLVDVCLKTALPDWPCYNGVTPSWDNSARRKEGAVIFKDASPQLYGEWLAEVLYRDQFRPSGTDFVFINAWNEWAEGNHLEPCSRWGNAYIQETKAARDKVQARMVRCGLHVGQVIVANDTAPGCLDENILDDSGNLHLSGWSVLPEPRRLPDALVLAEKLPEGGYRLVHGVRDAFRSRPDVAAHLGNASLANAGWRLAIPEGRSLSGQTLAVLAFDSQSGSFYVAGSSFVSEAHP